MSILLKVATFFESVGFLFSVGGTHTSVFAVFAVFAVFDTRMSLEAPIYVGSGPRETTYEKEGQAGAALKVRGQRKGMSLSEVEDVLRGFDMTTKYGPCAGISRSERWQRAEELGLNPDPVVLSLISNHNLDVSVWDSGVKGSV